LEEAIVAYRRALEEQPRDRAPLDWAFTETSLGAALVILGEREKGTARLEEAVAALHEALKERTREDTPFLWAQTQEKLALAHFALFDKGSEPTHRDDALNAIGGALEEYGKAKAVFYIEKAARLREKILAARDRKV
jgi:tetratricopeptide (TPR) repeat protein